METQILKIYQSFFVYFRLLNTFCRRDSLEDSSVGVLDPEPTDGGVDDGDDKHLM